MDERRVKQLIGMARLRLRAQRVAEGLATGLLPSLMAGASWLVLVKTGWLEASSLGLWVGWTAVFPLSGLVWAFSSRVDSSALAMRIDEANQLKARLTTAHCFLEIPEAERTPFQRAAIREALPHLERVAVAPAAPFALPRSAWTLGLAVLAVLLVIAFKPPVRTGTLPPPDPPVVRDEVFDDEDLQLAKEEWESVKADLKDSDNPDVEKMIGQMDAMLGQLDSRELDKGDFLKEVEEIKDTFFKDSENQEWKQILDEMKDASDVLKDDPLTKELAKALEAGDMKKAAEELEALGQQLADGKISDKDLDKLASKLEALSKQLDKNAEALEKALKEKEEELSRLQKQLEEKAKELSTEEKQRLSRLERQLKELKRKKVAFDESGKAKTMSKLSKAAKKGSEMATESKKKGKGAAKGKEQQEQARKEFGQAMKAAAEESRSVDKKSGEGKAMEQASRNLDKMKERLRRQAGQKDAQAQENKQAFADKAQGKEPGKKEGEPKEGSGDAPDGGDPKGPAQAGAAGGKEERGADKPSEVKDGAGGQKSAQGDPNAKEKEGDGPAGSQIEGEGDRAGGAAGEKGQGEETGIKDAKFVDTKVDGKAGAGPTRSEVVQSAAQQGFASTPYREAYEYEHRVAEEALEQEQVPPGYRFYVERYFEMIRPRDAAAPAAAPEAPAAPPEAPAAP